jgi:PAS domain S-box-containing protein
MGDDIRVLHVDDEPGFTDTAAVSLEREDDRFTVETATSGNEGLDRLTNDIDCVVSDYEMPGMDGIEFLSAVREEYPDLPFVLFTGKGSEEIASDAISAGVTDYLRKRAGQEQYELLATRIGTAVGQYRAEQELERQNDLFAKAQDLADVGAWEWNPQEETGYYTDQVYDIYGVDPDYEGTPEEDIQRFYHPEDRDTLRDAVAGAIESGDNYDIEVRVIAADGTEKWVRTRGDPHFEDGTCERVRGTIRDITERKERERDLEQQRQRLTVALEGSKAGVWEWVPGTNEVVWHESTERLFGLEPGTFEGTYEAFARRVHDEDIDALEAAIEEAFPDHDPFDAEYRIYTADDTELWAYARGEFIDIEGLSPRYIGVITDITERKEREHDLEQTTEWYQTLLDTAPDAVFVADAESGVIRETNQAATRLLDRPREEIVGMHQTKLHPPEKVEEYAELFEKHVAAGSGRDETLGEQVDIYVLDADGEEVPVEINARTVEIDGEYLNQGYFRDITDRKQRERELQRQNERLDEFVSVVSHDLRNPLHALSASLELLETEDEDDLERCWRSVDRMEHLLDDLLTLARHGETDSEEAPVSLAAVTRESARTTVPPGVSLSVETDATIVAEEARLKQLFENLFANSVEHGSTSPRSQAPGEAVEHGSTSSQARPENDGADVSITVGDIDAGFYVADDGTGIPPEERENCFEIGYSTSEDGTGFGLNIVKQVVAAHGWEVRVTDSDAGGARFEVTGVERVD